MGCITPAREQITEKGDVSPPPVVLRSTRGYKDGPPDGVRRFVPPPRKGLAEEQPLAYKNVDDVVEVVDSAGLSRKVARMRPLGVIKG